MTNKDKLAQQNKVSQQERQSSHIISWQNPANNISRLTVDPNLLPDAIYWPFERLQESKLNAYVIACVDTALWYSEDARTIYAGIIRQWESPDCQVLINDFDQHKQDCRAWLRDRAEAVVGNQPLPDCPDGWKDVIAKAEDNTDFLKLLEYVACFVLIAFNRKADIENQTPKVLPRKSPHLAQAIVFHSLLYYLQVIQKLRGPRVISDTELTGIHWFCRTLTSNPTTRMNRQVRRRIIQTLRSKGFRLHNYQTIVDRAEIWYRARVLCDTAREAADYYHIDPIDLSKRIEPYDDATGWPRHR